jgi:hypothetical protein
VVFVLRRHSISQWLLGCFETKLSELQNIPKGRRMKLLLAGNSGNGEAGRLREDSLIRLGASRLFSFFWAGPEKEFHNHFVTWCNLQTNDANSGTLLQNALNTSNVYTDKRKA